MPILMNGNEYYRTNEVCRMANISRSTLLRWMQSGTISDTPHRDRRGWRLFSVAYIQMLKCEVNRISRL